MVLFSLSQSHTQTQCGNGKTRQSEIRRVDRIRKCLRTFRNRLYSRNMHCVHIHECAMAHERRPRGGWENGWQ